MKGLKKILKIEKIKTKSNLQILFIIKLLITEIRIIQVPFSGALFNISIVQGIFAP